MNLCIRINQIKLRVDHNDNDLSEQIYKKVKELSKTRYLKELEKSVAKALLENDGISYIISKRSVDSRHKPDVYYIYSIDITDIRYTDYNKMCQKLYRLSQNNTKLPSGITVVPVVKYVFPVDTGRVCVEEKKIVIVGFGPAGMFAALKLVEAGFKPVILERGQSVDERSASVEHFWKTGILNTESNVQFGEGGAGTFSDGKLNTMIKDSTGRIREVLSKLVLFGADESVMYVNKPHIGTDVLKNVVKNIREYLIANGAQIYFNTKVTDIDISDGCIRGVTALCNGEYTRFEADVVCLSIGHSARDTFAMLNDKSVIRMEPKSFAVGLRIEHPQDFINDNAYGGCEYPLPAADYKVTYKTTGGRGVYSFCMCPGGYVVNASSEGNMLAVNGMSYSDRGSANANSAIIVTVTPDDYGTGVLDGVKFQRKLEQKAFDIASGAVPVQLVKDFKNDKESEALGRVIPCIKGSYKLSNLRKILPEYISDAICEGITGFDGLIKGFDMDDAVLSGIESRTSSPLRIVRDDTLQSTVKGLYPCGEGAGYAGGITSAAVDGIKVAEQIALKLVTIQ